jgi:Acyl-CoA dehydrogenase, C-terminal domain
VRFDVAPELRLFGESVRAAIGAWEAPLVPELGTWVDDRDDGLAERLAAAGWQTLWEGGDLGAVVAGGLELGRAVVPLCVVDEAALGAPLSVGGRIRHGEEAESCAVSLPGWGLAVGRPDRDRVREPTLDGTGTVSAAIADVVALAPADADARWSTWTAASLAYSAGLARAALDAAVRHARAREQFGRPLAALPAVQARLADSALAVGGLLLTAWQAATPSDDRFRRAPALAWSGRACRDVTVSAHQVHGAVGFALESGLHRYYRRAKAAQVWADAVCQACE